jgi:hypothetical protein
VHHASTLLCNNEPGQIVRSVKISLYCSTAILMALTAIPIAGQMRTGPAFHSTMPAGYTVVRLEPSGTNVSFLGLIECSEIEGAQQVSQGLNAKVVDSHGVPLRTLPHHVSFRITASLRKTLIDPPLDTVSSGQTPSEFLLKLGFRLKVYHGLERRELFPESVTMIGVPSDVAYDERVFRASFDLEDLPVTDRVVLEIVSPEDEVITHFSFGML